MLLDRMRWNLVHNFSACCNKLAMSLMNIRYVTAMIFFPHFDIFPPTVILYGLKYLYSMSFSICEFKKNGGVKGVPLPLSRTAMKFCSYLPHFFITIVYNSKSISHISCAKWTKFDIRDLNVTLLPFVIIATLETRKDVLFIWLCMKLHSRL